MARRTRNPARTPGAKEPPARDSTPKTARAAAAHHPPGDPGRLLLCDRRQPRTVGAPIGTPAPTPTSTPAVGAIDHRTGSNDLVLRLESGGGFVPIDFLATQAPSFSLYGDGVVIFRDPATAPPAPIGDINRSAPFQAVRLSEEQIQALLEFAIGEGGLGLAAGPYMGHAADLPTTMFTIKAGGLDKTVSVTGLGLEWTGSDALIVSSLGRLSERLGRFGTDVSGEGPWTPERYRGVLNALDAPFGAVTDWPWPAIKPAEFVAPPGGNDFLRYRTMTPADVAALKIAGLEGGLMGFTFKQDGKFYSFALRPLLPDEAS